jgi:hypothetical protein
MRPIAQARVTASWRALHECSRIFADVREFQMIFDKAGAASGNGNGSSKFNLPRVARPLRKTMANRSHRRSKSLAHNMASEAVQMIRPERARATRFRFA